MLNPLVEAIRSLAAGFRRGRGTDRDGPEDAGCSRPNSMAGHVARVATFSSAANESSGYLDDMCGRERGMRFLVDGTDPGIAVNSAVSVAFQRMPRTELNPADGSLAIVCGRTAVASHSVPAPFYYEVLIGQLGRSKAGLDDGLNTPTTPTSPTDPWQSQPKTQTNPKRRSLFSRPKPSPPPDQTLPLTYLVSLGMVTRPHPPNVLPGFAPGSIAFLYSPYEGCFISTCSQSRQGKVKTKRYELLQSHIGLKSDDFLHLRSGDILGVGIEERGVFFTLNGQRLLLSRKRGSGGCIPVPEYAFHDELFPALGANGPAQLLANFGESEFVWQEEHGGLPGYEEPPAYNV